MIKIVLDTNIVVSAALSAQGNSAKIITIIADDENIQFYYSRDILTEYKRVLRYERLKIPNIAQEKIIASIIEFGIEIEQIAKSTHPMPDESDRVFYDTAKTADAILITGNIKHFPNEHFIMTPADFLAKF